MQNLGLAAARISTACEPPSRKTPNVHAAHNSFPVHADGLGMPSSNDDAKQSRSSGETAGMRRE
jgi:hypothetical protein